MFYVANLIKLSVVSEILWKSNLLVRYKLDIFPPLQVNNFDISALLFGVYSRFIPLDKIFFYGYWKALPSGSSLGLYTFCYNIKYLLLKLLCTLAHLCEVTPLQPFQIDFFGIRGPCSQLSFLFSLFVGRATR